VSVEFAVCMAEIAAFGKGTYAGDIIYRPARRAVDANLRNAFSWISRGEFTLPTARGHYSRRQTMLLALGSRPASRVLYYSAMGPIRACCDAGPETPAHRFSLSSLQ
jgi:hypothetical protein